MFSITLVREALFGAAGEPHVALPPGKYNAKPTVDRKTGAPAIGIPYGVVELVVPLRFAHRFFDGWGPLPGSAPAVPGL